MNAQDKYENARQNAAAWLASIEEMLAAAKTQDNDNDHGREIEESVLSVQVRNGWYSPGDMNAQITDPDEYEILLTTGGPALRIYGQLNQHAEPDSAELQMQDWGVPWERFPASEETLLEFASYFWFGA